MVPFSVKAGVLGRQRYMRCSVLLEEKTLRVKVIALDIYHIDLIVNRSNLTEFSKLQAFTDILKLSAGILFSRVTRCN